MAVAITIFCKNNHLKEHDHILVVAQDLSGEFGLAPCNNEEALLDNLSAIINNLINTDVNRLIGILYRLDISETRIRQTLHENSGKRAGELLAALVVERQLEKVKTRAQFKSQEDIPDEDKW